MAEQKSGQAWVGKSWPRKEKVKVLVPALPPANGESLGKLHSSWIFSFSIYKIGSFYWRVALKTRGEKDLSILFVCFSSNQKEGKNTMYLVSVSVRCMLFKFSCIFSSLRAMKQHCHKFSLKWKHDWGCSPGTKITYSTNRIKAVWGNINGIAPNYTNAFQLDSSILPKSSNGAPWLSAHLSSWQGYEVRKENMGILH